MDYIHANNRERQIEYRTFLSLSDYVEDDAKLYFANTNYNALVIVDKTTWTVEQIIPFEGENLAVQNMHLSCIKKADKICFLPANSKRVHIFDVEEKRQYVCDLPDQDVEEKIQGKWEYYLYDGQTYLLPGYSKQRLWRWNVPENILEVEEWWSVYPADSALWHGRMDDECFYTLVMRSNQLFITNMRKRTTEAVCLPDERIRYITYDGKNFWYAMQDNLGEINLDIVCWNQKDGVLNRYNLQNDFGQESDHTFYSAIFFAAGHLFVFSALSMEIYVLDTDQKRIIPIHFIQCSRGAFQCREVIPSFKQIGNTLVCMLRNAGEVVLVDLDTLEAKQHSICFSIAEKDQEYAYRVALCRNALLYEEPDKVGLDTLIRFCMENDKRSYLEDVL